MRLAQKASKYNYNEERTLERETIFNQLFISLKDKGVLSSKEDTIKCMRDNPTLVDIICGKSNSKFDNAGDLIRLEYRGSSYEDVIQYYDIRVSMNKMDFILKKF
ncbi:hypothetical protein IAI10_07995 [Clostridium sp. 19966]|uniref:hypothetical protein n=1 Tax=Clostridium sp. 19966 TaxID=2768166 RepID=UPI0028DE4239|nr:hypothetical protein [Clostridium sp. 19966]MDT8716595.1 hypothetical protein [Clostridium sp. 19966]